MNRRAIGKALLMAIGILMFGPSAGDSADPLPWRSQLGALMRLKLAHSQLIMEGLVTNDLAKIQQTATKMSEMNKQSHWPGSRDRVYAHYDKLFKKQCDQLSAHAKDLDLEASHHVFLALSTTCIQCHQHVRNNLRTIEDLSNPRNPVRLIPSTVEDFD